MSKDTQHSSKSQPQLPTNHANVVDSKQSSVPNLIISVDSEPDEKHSPRDALKEDKKKKSFVDISKFMKVIKGHKDKDKDLSGDESEMPEVRRATRSDKEKERDGKELRRLEKEKEKERHREEKEAKKKTKQHEVSSKDVPSGAGPSVSFANTATSPRTAQQISDDIIKTAISRVQSFDVVSEEVTGSTISSMASEPEEYSTTKFIADNAKTKYSGGVTKVKLEEGQTEEDWEICKLADHTWAGQKRYHVPHGFGELRLMNGDLIYSGHWKEGKRHGQGAGTFKDGIYSGHWKSGQPDGEGTLTTDKFTFKGHWAKGQKDGYGNLERKNGFKYAGEWKNDQKNGYGSVYWPDGAKYEGEWEADKREGYGICVYVDGERYTGNWNDHWRSGKGVSVYPNGNRYVGEWYKDMKQGKGTLFLSLDKKLYEGEWWRNKRHGHGQQFYLNGDHYIGDWILDKKDGEGTYIGFDGSEYHGNWVNDKREGVGKLKYQNGDEYVGNWKEDMRNGSGAFIWKDYGKFVGEWKQDKIYGPGEYYTFKNKKPLQGTFEELQLIDSEGTYVGLSMLGKRWGRGKQEFSNGNVYNGEWKIGRMSGFGIMRFANGDSYEGFWLGGQRNGFGKFTNSDGRKYVGHWKRDKQEGRGTMTYTSGDLIDCTFTNGVSADFLNGILRYANKQVYRGPLKNGCPHGIGSLYIPQVEFLHVGALVLTMYRQWQEGNMLDGDGSFEANNGFVYEGEFIGLSCHGVGQLTYGDGSCYLGQWENDLMHGLGQFTSVEGDIYRGFWQRGQRHGWGTENYADGGKFIGAWRLDNRHGCGIFQWPDGAFTLREYRSDDLVTERAISGEDVKTVLAKIPASTFEQQIDNLVQAIREKQRDSSKHMLSMKKAVGEVSSKGTTPVVPRNAPK